MYSNYYYNIAKRENLNHKLIKVDPSNPELIWNARKMHYRLKNL